MMLSIPKCVSILIATRQKLGKCQGIKLNVNINNVDLPCVNSTKILGVHFDATLSWKDHVTHVRKKISKNLFLLKSIKCFLPLSARKLFYDSYILPYFDFCSIIWGNCPKYVLADLEKIHKRAARIILNQDINTRSHVLFSELRWMPLADRIDYHRSIQVYKCLNNNNNQGPGNNLSGVAVQFATQLGASAILEDIGVAVFRMENSSLAHARILNCYTIFLKQIIP